MQRKRNTVARPELSDRADESAGPSRSGFAWSRGGHHEEQAKSLIEVLIAVLILGIIATALMPMLGDYTGRARKARAEANLAIKEKALERYGAEHTVPAGYVYDVATGDIVTYGPVDGIGAAHQMLNPTDVNGNAMDDPIAASPGPFSYGPYLASLPAEPASVLLAAGGPVGPAKPVLANLGINSWWSLSVSNDMKVTSAFYHAGVVQRASAQPGFMKISQAQRLGAMLAVAFAAPLPADAVTAFLAGDATLFQVGAILQVVAETTKKGIVFSEQNRMWKPDEAPGVDGLLDLAGDLKKLTEAVEAVSPLLAEKSKLVRWGEMGAYAAKSLEGYIIQYAAYDQAYKAAKNKLTPADAQLLDKLRVSVDYRARRERMTFGTGVEFSTAALTPNMRGDINYMDDGYPHDLQLRATADALATKAEDEILAVWESVDNPTYSRDLAGATAFFNERVPGGDRDAYNLLAAGVHNDLRLIVYEPADVATTDAAGVGFNFDLAVNRVNFKQPISTMVADFGTALVEKAGKLVITLDVNYGGSFDGKLRTLYGAATSAFVPTSQLVAGAALFKMSDVREIDDGHVPGRPKNPCLDYEFLDGCDHGGQHGPPPIVHKPPRIEPPDVGIDPIRELPEHRWLRDHVKGGLQYHVVKTQENLIDALRGSLRTSYKLQAIRNEQTVR